MRLQHTMRNVVAAALLCMLASLPVLAQRGQTAGRGSASATLPEDMSTYQCSHFDETACDQAPNPPPNNSLVGTWVRISLLRNAFSVQPPDAPLYVKFGSDGHWSMMEFPAGRPKLNKPLDQQTPQELFNRFDKMDGGYGTYLIQGQTVNRRHVSNLGPGGGGGDQVREWSFEGNILALIGTGPTRSPQARFRKLPPQPVSSTALVGTWDRTALTVNAQAVTGPLLQQWIVLGEDGWFHQTAVPSGRKAPGKPMEQYTVQDYVGAYTGLSAARGVYNIQGTTLTRKHLADTDPNLTGWDEVAQFTLGGDTLTLQGTNERGEKVQATYNRLKALDPYAGK